jgi:hypothetical protein
MTYQQLVELYNSSMNSLDQRLGLLIDAYGPHSGPFQESLAQWHTYTAMGPLGYGIRDQDLSIQQISQYILAGDAEPLTDDQILLAAGGTQNPNGEIIAEGAATQNKAASYRDALEYRGVYFPPEPVLTRLTGDQPELQQTYFGLSRAYGAELSGIRSAAQAKMIETGSTHPEVQALKEQFGEISSLGVLGYGLNTGRLNLAEVAYLSENGKTITHDQLRAVYGEDTQKYQDAADSIGSFGGAVYIEKPLIEPTYNFDPGKDEYDRHIIQYLEEASPRYSNSQWTANNLEAYSIGNNSELRTLDDALAWMQKYAQGDGISSSNFARNVNDLPKGDIQFVRMLEDLHHLGYAGVNTDWVEFKDNILREADRAFEPIDPEEYPEFADRIYSNGAQFWDPSQVSRNIHLDRINNTAPDRQEFYDSYDKFSVADERAQIYFLANRNADINNVGDIFNIIKPITGDTGDVDKDVLLRHFERHTWRSSRGQKSTIPGVGLVFGDVFDFINEANEQNPELAQYPYAEWEDYRNELLNVKAEYLPYQRLLYYGDIETHPVVTNLTVDIKKIPPSILSNGTTQYSPTQLRDLPIKSALMWLAAYDQDPTTFNAKYQLLNKESKDLIDTIRGADGYVAPNTDNILDPEANLKNGAFGRPAGEDPYVTFLNATPEIRMAMAPETVRATIEATKNFTSLEDLSNTFNNLIDPDDVAGSRASIAYAKLLIDDYQDALGVSADLERVFGNWRSDLNPYLKKLHDEGSLSDSDLETYNYLQTTDSLAYGIANDYSMEPAFKSAIKYPNQYPEFFTQNELAEAVRKYQEDREIGWYGADQDNDGVSNKFDELVYNANYSLQADYDADHADVDEDGIRAQIDLDDNNPEISNSQFSYDQWHRLNADADEDGIIFKNDLDDNNSQITDDPDTVAAYELSITDEDGDGVFANADIDDDNDQITDDPATVTSYELSITDEDGDGVFANVDLDDDNNQITADPDTVTAYELSITDNDGDGYTADVDIDDNNDNYYDANSRAKYNIGQKDDDADGVINKDDFKRNDPDIKTEADFIARYDVNEDGVVDEDENQDYGILSNIAAGKKENEYQLFDFDKNGEVDALTDALLFMRALLNVPGASMVKLSRSSTATATTEEIVDLFEKAKSDPDSDLFKAFDLNQDGKLDALTDGLLMLRYAFGSSRNKSQNLANQTLTEDSSFFSDDDDTDVRGSRFDPETGAELGKDEFDLETTNALYDHVSSIIGGMTVQKDTDGNWYKIPEKEYPIETYNPDRDSDGVHNRFDEYPDNENYHNEDTKAEYETNTKDSDGDGVLDIDDPFPNDGSETVDSDGDGVGDNADYYPNNSDRQELKDRDEDGVDDRDDPAPDDANITNQEEFDASRVKEDEEAEAESLGFGELPTKRGTDRGNYRQEFYDALRDENGVVQLFNNGMTGGDIRYQGYEIPLTTEQLIDGYYSIRDTGSWTDPRHAILTDYNATALQVNKTKGDYVGRDPDLTLENFSESWRDGSLDKKVNAAYQFLQEYTEGEYYYYGKRGGEPQRVTINYGKDGNGEFITLLDMFDARVPITGDLTMHRADREDILPAGFIQGVDKVPEIEELYNFYTDALIYASATNPDLQDAYDYAESMMAGLPAELYNKWQEHTPIRRFDIDPTLLQALKKAVRPADLLGLNHYTEVDTDLLRDHAKTISGSGNGGLYRTYLNTVADAIDKYVDDPGSLSAEEKEYLNQYRSAQSQLYSAVEAEDEDDFEIEGTALSEVSRLVDYQNAQNFWADRETEYGEQEGFVRLVDDAYDHEFGAWEPDPEDPYDKPPEYGQSQLSVASGGLQFSNGEAYYGGTGVPVSSVVTWDDDNMGFPRIQHNMYVEYWQDSINRMDLPAYQETNVLGVDLETSKRFTELSTKERNGDEETEFQELVKELSNSTMDLFGGELPEVWFDPTRLYMKTPYHDYTTAEAAGYTAEELKFSYNRQIENRGFTSGGAYNSRIPHYLEGDSIQDSYELFANPYDAEEQQALRDKKQAWEKTPANDRRTILNTNANDSRIFSDADEARLAQLNTNENNHGEGFFMDITGGDAPVGSYSMVWVAQPEYYIPEEQSFLEFVLNNPVTAIVVSIVAPQYGLAMLAGLKALNGQTLHTSDWLSLGLAALKLTGNLQMPVEKDVAEQMAQADAVAAVDAAEAAGQTLTELEKAALMLETYNGAYDLAISGFGIGTLSASQTVNLMKMVAFDGDIGAALLGAFGDEYLVKGLSVAGIDISNLPDNVTGWMTDVATEMLNGESFDDAIKITAGAELLGFMQEQVEDSKVYTTTKQLLEEAVDDLDQATQAVQNLAKEAEDGIKETIDAIGESMDTDLLADLSAASKNIRGSISGVTDQISNMTAKLNAEVLTPVTDAVKNNMSKFVTMAGLDNQNLFSLSGDSAADADSLMDDIKGFVGDTVFESVPDAIKATLREAAIQKIALGEVDQNELKLMATRGSITIEAVSNLDGDLVDAIGPRILTKALQNTLTAATFGGDPGKAFLDTIADSTVQSIQTAMASGGWPQVVKKFDQFEDDITGKSREAQAAADEYNKIGTDFNALETRQKELDTEHNTAIEEIARLEGLALADGAGDEEMQAYLTYVENYAVRSQAIGEELAQIKTDKDALIAALPAAEEKYDTAVSAVNDESARLDPLLQKEFDNLYVNALVAVHPEIKMAEYATVSGMEWEGEYPTAEEIAEHFLSEGIQNGVPVNIEEYNARRDAGASQYVISALRASGIDATKLTDDERKNITNYLLNEHATVKAEENGQTVVEYLEDFNETPDNFEAGEKALEAAYVLEEGFGTAPEAVALTVANRRANYAFNALGMSAEDVRNIANNDVSYTIDPDTGDIIWGGGGFMMREWNSTTKQFDTYQYDAGGGLKYKLNDDGSEPLVRILERTPMFNGIADLAEDSPASYMTFLATAPTDAAVTAQVNYLSQADRDADELQRIKDIQAAIKDAPEDDGRFAIPDSELPWIVRVARDWLDHSQEVENALLADVEYLENLEGPLSIDDELRLEFARGAYAVAEGNTEFLATWVVKTPTKIASFMQTSINAFTAWSQGIAAEKKADGFRRQALYEGKSAEEADAIFREKYAEFKQDIDYSSIIHNDANQTHNLMESLARGVMPDSYLADQKEMSENIAAADGALDTVIAITGEIIDKPDVFLGTYIAEELPTAIFGLGLGSAAGRLTSLAAAKVVGKEAAESLATGSTVSMGASRVADLSEAFGETAYATYEEAKQELERIGYEGDIEAKAQEIAIKAGTTAMVLVGATAPFGAFALDNAILNASTKKAVKEVAQRVEGLGDTLTKETVTEVIQGGFTQGATEVFLYNAGVTDRDVAGNIAGSATLEGLVGGTTAGIITGLSTPTDTGTGFDGGDPFASLLFSNPDIKGAVEAGDATQVQALLGERNLTDTSLYVEVMNTVDDANYVTPTEVRQAFGYLGVQPTGDEVVALTNKEGITDATLEAEAEAYWAETYGEELLGTGRTTAQHYDIIQHMTDMINGVVPLDSSFNMNGDTTLDQADIDTYIAKLPLREQNLYNQYDPTDHEPTGIIEDLGGSLMNIADMDKLKQDIQTILDRGESVTAQEVVDMLLLDPTNKALLKGQIEAAVGNEFAKLDNQNAFAAQVINKLVEEKTIETKSKDAIKELFGDPNGNTVEEQGVFGIIEGLKNMLDLGESDATTLAGYITDKIGTAVELDEDGKIKAGTGSGLLGTLTRNGVLRDVAIAELATVLGSAGDGTEGNPATGIYAIANDAADTKAAVDRIEADYGTLDTEYTALKSLYDTAITNMQTNLGSPGIADDPATDVDEYRSPTGLYALVGKAIAAGDGAKSAVTALLGEYVDFAAFEDALELTMKGKVDEVVTAFGTPPVYETEDDGTIKRNAAGEPIIKDAATGYHLDMYNAMQLQGVEQDLAFTALNGKINAALTQVEQVSSAATADTIKTNILNEYFPAKPEDYEVGRAIATELDYVQSLIASGQFDANYDRVGDTNVITQEDYNDLLSNATPEQITALENYNTWSSNTTAISPMLEAITRETGTNFAIIDRRIDSVASNVNDYIRNNVISSIGKPADTLAGTGATGIYKAIEDGDTSILDVLGTLGTLEDGVLTGGSGILRDMQLLGMDTTAIRNYLTDTLGKPADEGKDNATGIFAAVDANKTILNEIKGAIPSDVATAANITNAVGSLTVFNDDGTVAEQGSGLLADLQSEFIRLGLTSEQATTAVETALGNQNIVDTDDLGSVDVYNADGEVVTEGKGALKAIQDEIIRYGFTTSDAETALATALTTNKVLTTENIATALSSADVATAANITNAVGSLTVFNDDGTVAEQGSGLLADLQSEFIRLGLTSEQATTAVETALGNQNIVDTDDLGSVDVYNADGEVVTEGKGALKAIQDEIIRYGFTTSDAETALATALTTNKVLTTENIATALSSADVATAANITNAVGSLTVFNDDGTVAEQGSGLLADLQSEFIRLGLTSEQATTAVETALGNQNIVDTDDLGSVDVYNADGEVVTEGKGALKAIQDEIIRYGFTTSDAETALATALTTNKVLTTENIATALSSADVATAANITNAVGSLTVFNDDGTVAEQGSGLLADLQSEFIRLGLTSEQATTAVETALGNQNIVDTDDLGSVDVYNADGEVVTEGKGALKAIQDEIIRYGFTTSDAETALATALTTNKVLTTENIATALSSADVATAANITNAVGSLTVFNDDGTVAEQGSGLLADLQSEFIRLGLTSEQATTAVETALGNQNIVDTDDLGSVDVYNADGEVVTEGKGALKAIQDEIIRYGFTTSDAETALATALTTNKVLTTENIATALSSADVATAANITNAVGSLTVFNDDGTVAEQGSGLLADLQSEFIRLGLTSEQATTAVETALGNQNIVDTDDLGSVDVYNADGEVVTEGKGALKAIQDEIIRYGFTTSDAETALATALTTNKVLTTENIATALSSADVATAANITNAVGSLTVFNDDGTVAEQGSGLLADLQSEFIRLGLTSEQATTAVETALGNQNIVDTDDLGSVDVYNADGEVVTEGKGALKAIQDEIIRYGFTTSDAETALATALTTNKVLTTENIATALSSADVATAANITNAVGSLTVFNDDGTVAEQGSGLLADLQSEFIRLGLTSEQATTAVETALGNQNIVDTDDLGSVDVYNADGEVVTEGKGALKAIQDEIIRYGFTTSDAETALATALTTNKVLTTENIATALSSADVATAANITNAVGSLTVFNDDGTVAEQGSGLLADLQSEFIRLGLTSEQATTAVETALGNQNIVDTDDLGSVDVYNADGEVVTEGKGALKAIQDEIIRYGFTSTDATTAVGAALTGNNVLTTENIATALSSADVATGTDITEATKGLATSDDIQMLADLIGKPVNLLTQEDYTLAEGYLQAIEDEQAVADAEALRYDVTGDGQLTQQDLDLLGGALDTGDYSQFAGTAQFRDVATGMLGREDQLEAELAARDAQIEADKIAQTQRDQDLRTQIQTDFETSRIEREAQEEQDKLFEAMQAPGRKVTTRTPDPVQIDEIYDFESIFRGGQQDAFYGSASMYGDNFLEDIINPQQRRAKGGIIKDQTDEILRIMGDK